MGQHGSKSAECNTNGDPENPRKRHKISDIKEDCERMIQPNVIFENHKSENGLDIVCVSEWNESEHESKKKVTGSFTDTTSKCNQANKLGGVKLIEESSTYATCKDFSLHSVHTVLDVECKQTCTYENSICELQGISTCQETEHLGIQFQKTNDNSTCAVREISMPRKAKKDEQEIIFSSSNETLLKESVCLKPKHECHVFELEKHVEKSENRKESKNHRKACKEIFIKFFRCVFQLFMKANNIREFLTSNKPLLQCHVVNCKKRFVWYLVILTLCRFSFNCLKDNTVQLISSQTYGIGKSSLSRELCLENYGNKFDVTINQRNISAFVIRDPERIHYELGQWRSSAVIQSILGNETRKQIHIKSEAFRLATFSFYDHVYMPGKTMELAKKGFYCDLDGRIRCFQCSQEYNDTHQGIQSVRCGENSDLRQNSIAESYGRLSTDYIFGLNQPVIDLRERRLFSRNETYMAHQVLRQGTVTPVPDDVGSAEIPLLQITVGSDRSLTVSSTVHSVNSPESSNPTSVALEISTTSSRCTHVRSGYRTTAMQSNAMNEMLERYSTEQANGGSPHSIDNRILENVPETLVQSEGSNNAFLSGSVHERSDDDLNTCTSNTRPFVNYSVMAHGLDQLRHTSNTSHTDTELDASSTRCVNGTSPEVESNFNRSLYMNADINCNDRTHNASRRVPLESSSLSNSQNNAEIDDNTVNADTLPLNSCCLTSGSELHLNESLTPHPSIFERGNAQVYSETNHGSLLQSASSEGIILQMTEDTSLNENDNIETLAVQLESLSIERYVQQESSRRVEVSEEPITEEEPKTTQK